MEPVNPKKDNITIISKDDTSTLQVQRVDYSKTLLQCRFMIKGVLQVVSTELMKYTQESFICEACNQLGCTQQTFHVNITQKLAAPVIGLWDIDSDSAEFYVSTESDATLYIFQYFFDVEDDNKWDKAFTKNFSTRKCHDFTSMRCIVVVKMS